MNKLKKFENYNDNNCEAELTIFHWGKDNGQMSNTYRLMVKLISPTGEVFHCDGTGLTETYAKKLIEKFGAKVEERY